MTGNPTAGSTLTGSGAIQSDAFKNASENDQVCLLNRNMEKWQIGQT